MQRITRSKSASNHAPLSVSRNSNSETIIVPPELSPHTEPLSPDKKLHLDSLKVPEVMKTLGIDLGTFIHGIFYGNLESRNDLVMRNARRSFIQSDKLSLFLGNIYQPPRSPNGKGRTPTTAKDTLIHFSAEIMQSIFASELSAFSATYAISDDEPVNPDELAKITSRSLYAKITQECKYLTRTLESLTGCEEPPYENTGQVKDPLASNAAILQELSVEDASNLPVNPHPHFVGVIILFIEF